MRKRRKTHLNQFLSMFYYTFFFPQGKKETSREKRLFCLLLLSNLNFFVPPFKILADFSEQRACCMMDLRVDTRLTLYSQFCICHMVKTCTKIVREGAEMDPKLQLSGLASGYQALQQPDTYRPT